MSLGLLVAELLPKSAATKRQRYARREVQSDQQAMSAMLMPKFEPSSGAIAPTLFNRKGMTRRTRNRMARMPQRLRKRRSP